MSYTILIADSASAKAMCPSCGSADPILVGSIPPINIFAGRELPYLLDNGFLYKCAQCALAFRFPRHSKAVLDDLYKQGSAEFWKAAASERVDWAIASSVIGERFVEASVLDIGCFDGGFLSRLGDGVKKYGIEMNAVALELAKQRGIQVLGEDFAVLDNMDKRFNAVVAMDVIEHVADPLAFLRQVSRVVVPGGLIFVSTGNTDALGWRLLGSNYWYCGIAEHISYINPRWCENAAATIGLQVERVQHISHLQWRWKLAIKELATSLCYMASPNLLEMLRHKGFGNRKPRYRLPLRYAPSWTTAKDHIAVVFHKP